MSTNTSDNTKTMITKSGRQLRSDGDSLIITEPNGQQQTVYCSKLTDKMIKEIAHDPDEARKMLECCRHDIQQCRKHNCPECKVCPENGGSSGNDCAPYKNKAYLTISVLLASFLIYGTYMISVFGLGYKILPWDIDYSDIMTITSNNGFWSTVKNIFKSILRFIVAIFLSPIFSAINIFAGPAFHDYFGFNSWGTAFSYYSILTVMMAAYICIIFYPLFSIITALILLVISFFYWGFNDIILTQNKKSNSTMKGGASVVAPSKIPQSIKKPTGSAGKISGQTGITEVNNIKIGNSSGKIVDKFGVMAPVYYLLAKAGTSTKKNKKITPEDLITQKNMKQIAAMTESLDAVHKKAAKVLGISSQTCPPCPRK